MAPPAARPAHRLRGRSSPRPADPPPRAWRPGTCVPAGPAGAPARRRQQRPKPGARGLAATPWPPGVPRLRDRDRRAAAASRPADRRGTLALTHWRRPTPITDQASCLTRTVWISSTAWRNSRGVLPSHAKRGRLDGSGPASCCGLEGIQQSHACAGQIGGVAGDQGPPPHLGRGGQQAIDDRKGIGNVQATPFLRYLGSDWDDAVRVVPEQRGQPGLVHRGLSRVTAPQPLDSLADLADYQNAQVQLETGHGCQPSLDIGIGCRLAGLGDDVGIEEIAHQLMTAACQPARSSSSYTTRARSDGRGISRAARSGPESRKSLKSGLLPLRRRYSSILTTTATSSPWRVTTWGPSSCACLTISLKRC